MGYFCPTNTFLQLEHYIPKIYLTLLSTTCVKIHQITYVIFETTCKSFFTTQFLCIFYFFCSNIIYLQQKQPMKVQIFRLSIARVKVHKFSHVIFQTKSQFSSKFGSFFSVMRDNSSVLFQLKLYPVEKSNSSKWKLSDLPLVTLKLTKFLMSFLEPRVNFSWTLFSVMKHNFCIFSSKSLYAVGKRIQ